MKTFLILGLGFLSLFFIRLSIAQTSLDINGNRFGGLRSTNEPKFIPKYDRIDEVKKQCSSILPRDSNKKPYGKPLFRLKDRLSFVNGDWFQDLGQSPLMPFVHNPNGSNSNGSNSNGSNSNGSNSNGSNSNGSNSNGSNSNGSDSDPRSPLSLISFWVTDVDRAHRVRNSVNINGIMRLGITMAGEFGFKPYENDPTFRIYQDHSELTVSFQGVVADNSDDNDGEVVMCLLGNTMLPYRYKDKSNPWDWVKEPGFMTQPPLIQDDQVLLVVRYPKTFSLTKRGVYGSLRSLSPKTSEKYFDEVHVSASLSGSANYEFNADKLVSKACDPYPYKDNVTDTGLGVYKGDDFCLILERFTGQDPLTVVPNWKCNGNGSLCSRLGPFESDESIRLTNGSFKDVRLSFQDVRCEESPVKGKTEKYTKVAGLIRVVPPFEDHYRVSQRTGLNNMTLSVEGMWKSSSGQLCMIGCRGIVDQASNGCDSRICLYIPLSFSIKQRSIILEKSQMIQVIDYTVKILLLVSFSLIVRLYQKVWRARVRLLTRAPLEPNRVPSDRRVLFVTVVVHVLGFVCVLVVHKVQPWLVELEEYAGLVQDFFLLPQVIGNLVWQIGCIPLRKSYFIGLTVIQLLPHVYDYIRSPIPNPYFSEEYEFVDPRLDFYSKVGDVLIPVIAILLAVFVHVQQKFGYERLAQALDFGKFRVLPRRTVAYERLPPVVAEAEMTSGVNGDGGATRKEVDIE
ncbi:hypothetical protein HanHA300_Chr04g0117491 [Helianthus annuus]|nr:hypothetical protein HanHA300_Chr04g0117491 [Helianthus annuus]KAJ0755954.1 hypothetical protein HanLR1_Chr04g0121661 [Helianthus annuus]